MNDRHKRIREIFLEVSALPETEQADALAHLCADDADCRSKVEALLHADRLAAGFMANPTAPGLMPITERAGSRVGPYKILQLVGEGGFGSVFLAEQDQPVRRRVALKIIKLGMDSKQVIARFEAERQALALMEHPHIAKVLDGGTTASGQPFFVMEYVVGDTITAFADAHALDVRARLDLFAQVCSAVQHAHTKGVIHRDIKPGNVLVSIVDGRPFARVIDFGIAKATSSRLTDRTLFTEHGNLIGTPEYMSPEQAEGSPDIDTRSDIYGLGVLLYELLTGLPPFDAKRLRSAAFAEMQRIIREEEPPAPSVRLLRSLPTPDAQAVPAAAKPASPPQDPAPRPRFMPATAAELRGELDWIVMKALEKNRNRRYETASALAEDIRRHLAGEPVLAVPPSAAYRLSKLVRKHRIAAAFAGFLLLAACGISAGLVWALVERERAERAAERSERIAAAVEMFARVHEQLSTLDAEGGAASLLRDNALTQLVTELDGGLLALSPSADHALRLAVIQALFTAGSTDTAFVASCDDAVELADRWLGATNPATLQLLSNMPLVLQRSGASDDRVLAAYHEFRARTDGVRGIATLGTSQWASEVIDYSSEYGSSGWSAGHAIGAPNTFMYGDIPTAWAPAVPGGDEQHITLGFATPVFASGVLVRQTLGNGFVRQIDVIDSKGLHHTVWVGEDDSQPGEPFDFVARFPTTKFLVHGVTIFVDVNQGPSFEEIDAVQLFGKPSTGEDLAAAELARLQSLDQQAEAQAKASADVEALLATDVPLESLHAVLISQQDLSPSDRMWTLAYARQRKSAILSEARDLGRDNLARHVTAHRALEAINASVELQPRVRMEALRWVREATRQESSDQIVARILDQAELPERPGDTAKVCLEEATRLAREEPDNLYVMEALGAAQYRAGQFEEAVQSLTRAKSSGDAPLAIFFLAMAYYQLDMEAKAQETLSEALTFLQIAGLDEEWSPLVREATQIIQPE